eukprot:6132766-Prymnesium_polylepis.1
MMPEALATPPAPQLTVFRPRHPRVAGLMHDAMVSEALEPGRCDEAAGTCGTWVAIPYHVSFQIIGVQ